jgi:hypothetical protein
MENKNSKLNTVLLLILIILMIIGISLFLDYKKTIEQGMTVNNVPEIMIDENINNTPQHPESVPTTYTYKNHGFTLELPIGYVPEEVQGETGPTISIKVPNGWLIYITNADWWVRYNLDGQANYIRDEIIGNATFRVYKYINQDTEFYFYRQGNVAYMFSYEEMRDDMDTFKFVGWDN